MKSEANRLLERIMRQIVTVLFSLFILYLTILSCFSTAAVNLNEQSYLIADSAWRNLAVEGLLLLAIVPVMKLYRKRHPEKAAENLPSGDKVVRALYVLLAVEALFFVLTVHKAPRADQLFICQASYELSNRIFSSMAPGGYLFLYPHQAGIVLFLNVLGSIFGHHHYIVFQLINIAALLQLVRCLAYFIGTKERSSAREAGVVLLCILFLPCVMYTTFVYGTLIGLSLIVTSFKCVLCFHQNRQIKHAVAAVLSMFLSITIKKNYLIFAIALILYIIYLQIKEKTGIHLLSLLPVFLMVIVLNSTVIDQVYFLSTGQHLGKGMSPLAYVLMGIREDTILYDGWWDLDESTIRTFESCGYDKEKHSEICKDRIQQRMSGFKKEPGKAVRFFAGKNASQWNNPDFEGWWINAAMPNDGQSVLPVWLEKLLSVPGYYSTIFRFLNYLQFIILSGVILHLLLGSSRKDVYLLLMITFLGGFLFHTFWEAKGQYTLVYFILLLPMSVDGYAETVRLFDRGAFSESKRIRWLSVKIGLLALLLFLVGSRAVPVLNSVFIRNEGTKAFTQYIDSFDTAAEGQ